MHVLYLILAILFGLGSFICWLWIVVDAFRLEPWMGLLSIVFPPYLIYYAIEEFDHDYKWQITVGWLLGSIVAGAFFLLSQGRPL